MGLIRRSKDNEIVRELSELGARKAQLVERLAQADRDIAAATDERRRLLEAGEAVKGDVLRELRDLRDATADALAAVESRISAAQERLDAERDRVEREAEIKTRREQIAAARAAAEDFSKVVERLADALRPLSGTGMSIAGTTAALSNFGNQARLAIDAAIGEAEGYCVRVQAGSETVRKPPPLAIPAPEPPKAPSGPRQRIYLHEHSKWREADGSMRTGCQWGAVELPVEVAQKAIALNLADAFTAPRAEKLREMHGVVHGPAAHPDDCVDLLTGLRASDATGPQTVEWVGPPRVLEAPRF